MHPGVQIVIPIDNLHPCFEGSLDHATGHHPQARVRTRVLRVWLDYYNLRRRHTAIGRLTPMQRLVELRITNVLGIYS